MRAKRGRLCVGDEVKIKLVNSIVADEVKTDPVNFIITDQANSSLNHMMLEQSDSSSIAEKKMSLLYAVKDHLTHDPVKLRKACLLMAGDSSFVDTIKRTYYEEEYFKSSMISVKVMQPGKYIVCLEADSFKTIYIPLEVKKLYKRELYRTMPDIFMRRLPKKTEIELGEVVVKATKLKFYMDGDTLVYDADAFNLSEGSMIDALLKKLPGVMLEKGGVIKVNGRKIDALLLNGKDFFDSNRELLLENMPAYMVKKVQTYERPPERLKGTLGTENAKKELVMNVRLKRDYSSGWLYNAEAGAGRTFLKDDEGNYGGKFLGRLFGMHFSDKSSFVAFANANNLNDETRPGEKGEWSPFSQSMGLATTYMAGMHFTTEKTDLFRYNGAVDGSYRDFDEANNTNAATFLEGGNTYTRSFFNERSYEWNVSSNHMLMLEHSDNWRELAKMLMFYATPSFSFRRWNNHSTSGSMSLSDDVSFQFGKVWMDSIMAPGGGNMLKKYAINRNVTLRKGTGHTVSERVDATLRFNPAHNDFISFMIGFVQSLSDDKNETFEHYRLDYPNASSVNALLSNTTLSNALPVNALLSNATLSNAPSANDFSEINASSVNRDFRNKYVPIINRNNSFTIEPSVDFYLDRKAVNAINVKTSFSHDYSYSNSPIYLLHKLDEWKLAEDGTNNHALGMLPSMEEMLQTIDRGNSSMSRSIKDGYNSKIGYRHNLSTDDGFKSFELTLEMPINRESLDYKRGMQLDTLVHRVKMFFNPQVSWYYYSKKHGDMSLSFDYSMSHSAPSMINLLNVHDDNDPLNVTLGNPELKNTTTHSLQANINGMIKKARFYLSANASITENAVASGFTFNKVTGVRTVKPQNVNGNWSFTSNAFLNMPLIGDYKLALDQSLSYNYVRSVDISGTEELGPSRSVVNNNTISESLSLVWRPTDKIEVATDGKLDYQRSTSARSDFADMNTFTFQYGARAQLDLPWHLQVSTDVTMYSRRGYSEASMNTNELVWNARLSKKLLKSHLTLMFDSFDLLGNLSNVQRYVNAQGRTETFYNVIPSYGLFHVLWQPVKKKKTKKTK